MKKFLTMLLTLMLLTGACAEPVASMPNPWTDTDAAGLMETLGVSFGVPENAENVIHRMLESWSLAELQFDIDGVHYNARIQPTAAFEDISGMYYEWMSDEPVTIGWCEGRLLYAQDEEGAADLLLWYDAAPGLMYSLSAISPVSVDLFPVAEAVYQITQDETGLTIDEVLAACTGYSGTAGESLKEANAACALISFAIENAAAENDLSETMNAVLDSMTDEQRADLILHMEGIRALMEHIFADFESLADLFDTAGCLENMENNMAAEGAEAHTLALLELIPQ